MLDSTEWGARGLEEGAPGKIRFGVYEADLRAGELRKHGMRIRLQDQPFRVLAMLLERPGDLVTREEFRQKVWPADTFVHFDHGLNKAINKLREALGDSAENPRFIETLPRRGYRFLVPVTHLGQRAATADTHAPVDRETKADTRGVSSLRVWLALGLLAAVTGAAWYLWSGGVARPRVSSKKVMLVVLPFSNLDGDPEQDYFCDGMTEEMILQLSRLRPDTLGVIARTSAMQYRKTSKRADEIGRELDVQYILEGTIRRTGNRVRITAQLVQAADQTYLWAETYEREVADVFSIQSGVAQRIARSLALELLPAQQAALSRAPTASAEAYESYLRGRFHWNKRTPADLQKSVAFFQRATKLDPGFALAYAGLADAYNVLPYYGLLPPRQAFPQSKAAAQRALELDPASAHAHTALAYAHHYFDWDWGTAEWGYARAQELNPNYAQAHQWLAAHLVEMGRVDEAVLEMELARQMDPLSLIVNAGLGWIQFHGRRYAQAEAQLQKTLELDPNFVPARLWLGQLYEVTGRRKEAVAEFRAVRELAGDAPTGLAELAHALAREGMVTEARQALHRLLDITKERYVPSDEIARAYLGLGDRDAALAWLEKGYEERAVKMALLAVDPTWDSLRSEARFVHLLQRISLPRITPPANR
ncbi:MAG: winged helix-turn-helix domain-containing protein [Acidobacteria bacterium]|nr:winged helix-turn-helix domain-containing protein [Acidobacteriota bacterium]